MQWFHNFVYRRFVATVAGIVVAGTFLGVGICYGQPSDKPDQVFLSFWEGFMAGDIEVIVKTLRSMRIEGMTPEDLQVRMYYPPLMSVEASEKGAEGVTLLSLIGTYVHPYDAKTMGHLSAYEARYGSLPTVELTYSELLEMVPEEFARRLESFVKDNNTEEIWLLDIPGRALLVTEDGVWKVDVYHFDDKTMWQTPPRRLIIDAKAPLPKGAE